MVIYERAQVSCTSLQALLGLLQVSMCMQVPTSMYTYVMLWVCTYRLQVSTIMHVQVTGVFVRANGSHDCVCACTCKFQVPARVRVHITVVCKHAHGS